jgi:hypothetical protein
MLPIPHGVLMGAGSLCDSGHKIVISTWKEVQRKYKSNLYRDVKLTDDVYVETGARMDEGRSLSIHSW